MRAALAMERGTQPPFLRSLQPIVRRRNETWI
nr:MAG TPA: hypothetical protein [Caudoviricetes sp.]